jgi:hypothetical protein
MTNDRHYVAGLEGLEPRDPRRDTRPLIRQLEGNAARELTNPLTNTQTGSSTAQH